MNLTLLKDKNTDSIVKRELFQKFSGLKHYNQPFLNPNDPHCNPQDYLEACTEKVNLEELYKFVDTPCYSETMSFFPAIFEIVAPRIRQRFEEKKYLIVAYNQSKKKIFTKAVDEPYKYWSICYEYLVLLTDDKNEDGTPTGGFSLRIHDFRRSNKSFDIAHIKLNDEIKNIFFFDDTLFMCSDTLIYVAAVPNLPPENHVYDINTDLKLRVINVGTKVLGFVPFGLKNLDNQMIVMIESPEHQLDFSRLKLTNLNGDEDEFKWTLLQHRQLKTSSNYIDDPIEKHVFTTADYPYGITIRKSGRFELYWNMTLIDIIDDQYVSECYMSLSSFYFRMHDGRYLRLDHKNSENYKFIQAYEISESEFNIREIYRERIIKQIKLFTNFTFGNVGDNNGALIANNDFVSLYDLTLKEWYNHVEFEVDIINMFKIKKNKDWGGSASVLMKNGAIYVGVLNYEDFKKSVATSKRVAKIDDTIIRYANDVENSDVYFVVTQNETSKQYKLVYLFRSEKSETKMVLKDFDHPETSNENLQVVFLQKRGDESWFVTVDGKTMRVYEFKADANDDPTFTLKKKFDNITIDGQLHSGTCDKEFKYLTLFDDKHMYFWNLEKNKPMKKYADVYAMNMQNFNENANFILCQEQMAENYVKGGLKCFSFRDLADSEKYIPLEITNSQIGALGQFEYYNANERLGFISGISSLNIIPQIQKSCMKFINFKGADKYVCFKEIQDKFMALDFKGAITTWSIPTGKLERVFQTEMSDLEQYNVFSKYKFGCVLLKSKEEVEIDQEKHFEPSQITKSISNQTPFFINFPKTIRRWQYIEIKNETEATSHFTVVHPSFEKEWLFVSEDKTKYIELGINFRCYFYQLVKDPSNPKLSRWQFIRSITDYPGNLENDANRLEFFSPNFTKYIVYNERDDQFILKDTILGTVIRAIPRELLACKQNKGGKEILRKPKQVMNRVKFQNDSTILVVSEDGVEKLVDIEDENFKELAFNFRPLFNEINGEEHLNVHYYVLRAKREQYEVLQRLQRKYQTYKTAYYLHGHRDITQLLNQLISVDQHVFQAELSFTILDWVAIEQIRQGRLQVDDLQMSHINKLIYNILPGGTTILHRLCDKEEQLMKILERAHPNNEKIAIHCPFIPNVIGETPIHRCIQKKDFKSIDVVLKYLKLYHLDHHSRGIQDLYPTFIEQDLPGFLEYIDERILQTEQAKSIKKGCLMENYPEILTVDLWFNQEKLYSQILMEKPVENRIKCSIIDLIGIYHINHPKFEDFFSAIAETENPEYFNKKVIQKAIELNYEVVVDAIIKRLFIPYCLFLAFYQFVMFVVMENKDVNSIWESFVYPSIVIILIFATYFIANEIKQFSQKGGEYFADVWNYIDIIPPVGIYVICVLIILNLFGIDVNTDLQRSINSFITFFMWFKLLYFLRIFKTTGYLIGMILEVVKDMRHFFLVLLVTIIAFASSFLAISLGNSEENQFTTSNLDATIFTYRMVLGDFDTGAFGEVATPVVWILFLLCTIFNMIVMLNLLIAIISETFARVTGLADQKIYQEMAALIAENSYLVSKSVIDTYAEENKYLMIVENLEAVQLTSGADQIAQLQKQLEETKSDMEKKMNEMAETLSKIEKAVVK